jgi:hypothetical protein
MKDDTLRSDRVILRYYSRYCKFFLSSLRCTLLGGMCIMLRFGDVVYFVYYIELVCRIAFAIVGSLFPPKTCGDDT